MEETQLEQAGELIAEALRLKSQGSIDPAIQLVLKAIALQPQMASYHGHLGDLYLQGGKPYLAKYAYHKALKINPQEPRARHFFRTEQDVQAGLLKVAPAVPYSSPETNNMLGMLRQARQNVPGSGPGHMDQADRARLNLLNEKYADLQQSAHLGAETRQIFHRLVGEEKT